MKPTPLNYAAAGVDIDKANQLVSRISGIAKRTNRPGVLAGIGGFGAAFEIPSHYKQPILVSGTDGVGTKLRLAIDLNRHHTIGIDLVAMCANDILCMGAEPLYFLDYFATGALKLEQATAIIEGIGQGCIDAGIALIGGETAEMPGMYHGDDYDLAGFCVGVVEKSKILEASRVQVGDVILGIASSGAHANGYSLIRKIVEISGANWHDAWGDSTLGDVLLTPTRVYVKSILTLMKQVSVHALAHITGGGLLENIPRVLPAQTQAILHTANWPMPPIFQWLQQHGNIADTEMQRTFNCGIGMVVILPEHEVSNAEDILRAQGETTYRLGKVARSQDHQPSVQMQ